MPMALSATQAAPKFNPAMAAKLLVPLSRLRPTQAAVGMRSVANKRRKVERRASRLDKFLDNRPIPSVRGPGGDLFMIDHHHLGLALWQAEVECAYVCVIEDLSVLPVAMFWQSMEASGRLHPFDNQGRRISPSRLPARLSGLDDDPYRDLAWSVRQEGGFTKTGEPYCEFVWADFFRDRLSRRLLRRDFEAAIKSAVRLARSPDAAHLPGFVGR